MKRNLKKLMLLLVVVLMVLVSAFQFVSAASSIKVTANRSEKGTSAQNVLDGNAKTVWTAHSVQPYLIYDLGKVVKVGSVKIGWAFSDHPSTPQGTAFKVDFSKDGKTWTTKLLNGMSKRGPTGLQDVQLTGVPADARYVKITGKYNDTAEWGQWISITEVEINDVSKKKLAVKKVTGTPDKENIAKKTLDGNLADASRYSSEVDWAHLDFDFGTTKVIQSVDIDFGNSTKQTTTYDIQFSDDGKTYSSAINWIKVCDKKEGFQNIKFSFSIKTRYMRIVGKYNSTLDNTEWITIREVKFNEKVKK